MEASQVYVLISIIVLLIIFILLFFTARHNKNKKQKNLTPLAGIAFAFVLVSLFFESRLIGYSLIAIGVLLAIIDIIKKRKII